jgi:two-component system response regulator DesR
MTTPVVSVLVVDDNDLVAGALERWLSKTPGIRWLGSTGNADEAVRLIAADSPDVVLLDLELPGTDSFGLIERMTAEFPHTRVVVLSGHIRAGCISRALEAGAAGYLVKDERIPRIVEHLRRAAAGERVLSSTAHAALVQAGSPALTKSAP